MTRHPRTAINVTKLIRRIEHPKPKKDDERRAAIMEILLVQDQVTRGEIVDMFAVHEGVVSQLIGCMVEEGLIARLRYGTYGPGEFYSTFWN